MGVAQSPDVTECGHEAIVRMLSQPTSYPERPSRVLVKETHISDVFLTDRYAYKLKKPVRFEFVDFRSLESRRRACEEEVRLNRRMAEGVYLGIEPVTVDRGGKLRLGGAGKAVAWVVKMRRLPEERMLDQLLESGLLRQIDVDRLSAFLADYYFRTPPLVVQPDEYRAEIEHHVRANRAELLTPEHDLPASLVRRVHTAQLLFLTSSPDVLSGRVCDGRIIDGHGDLRPEHICLNHQPVVFDCLEFSQQLRQLDVLDELGFLAMECDLVGAEFVGQRVIDAYLDRSGDTPPDGLLWFYKSYRACVRAKVCALRASQMRLNPGTEAGSERLLQAAHVYLDLAGLYAASLASPFVVVVRGLMGSGKTTLSTILAETLGVARFGTDDVRRELFGPSRSPAEYNAGHYTPQERGRVYDVLLARCASVLGQGESVVLDGTFLSADLVRRVDELASVQGVRLLVVACGCPTAVAEQRIAARRAGGEGTSEAGPELLAAKQVEFKQVPQHVRSVEIDTTHSLNTVLNTVVRQLVD